MSEVDQALALLSRGTHEILVEDELRKSSRPVASCVLKQGSTLQHLICTWATAYC
ncbi:hypothetical protein HAALTHF_03540n [Vreelandella aquamarina]|nr:hypothetical protein HAALTHF_03540n [Halomonas axialensis]